MMKNGNWNLVPLYEGVVTFVIFHFLVQIQVAKTREALITSEQNIYKHVEWGTVISQTRNLNLHNGFAYFGIGSCERKETSLAQLQHASSTKNVIQVFSTVMRINCQKDLVDSLGSLFDIEYIKLKKDHSIILNIENLKSKGEQLLQNKDKVFLAFRLVVVSQIYVSMQLFPAAPNTPDGEKVSDQIFVLVNMILGMFDIAAKHFPFLLAQFGKEFLNLCNSLVPPTVDRAFLRFSYSRYSKDDKKSALNDLLMVSAIREFVFEKSKAASATTGDDLHDLFKTYYISKKAAYLKEVADLYPWVKQHLHELI